MGFFTIRTSRYRDLFCCSLWFCKTRASKEDGNRWVTGMTVSGLGKRQSNVAPSEFISDSSASPSQHLPRPYRVQSFISHLFWSSTKPSQVLTASRWGLAAVSLLGAQFDRKDTKVSSFTARPTGVFADTTIHHDPWTCHCRVVTLFPRTPARAEVDFFPKTQHGDIRR